MAKFYGPVGFGLAQIESAPDVWEERPIERNYYGDIVKNNRRFEASGTVNTNVTTSNQISIVADPYAFDNCFSIKYVKYKGVLWSVTNVEIDAPRIILTLGGRYVDNE